MQFMGRATDQDCMLSLSVYSIAYGVSRGGSLFKNVETSPWRRSPNPLAIAGGTFQLQT